MKKKLFYRAKGMLVLLEAFGSRIGKIDFQKYLFLWTREQDEPIYDFVPYKYGCFSFQSCRDMEKLQELGYEGHSIEAYMNLLIKQNMKVLCDVRKNPLSRKYGFSKNQLKNICNNLNIEYINIPSLGIKSQLRWNLKSMKEYEKLFKNYKKNTLRHEGDSLRFIIDLLNKKKRIALTCFEKEPEMCHRNCVADAIYKKTEKKIKIINL